MHYGTFLARSFGEEAEASAVGALSSPSTMPTKAIKPVVASLVVVVLIISTGKSCPVHCELRPVAVSDYVLFVDMESRVSHIQFFGGFLVR